MITSANDSWNPARKAFADQFEPDGNNFIYRRSQKGEAIRVSAEERSRFVDAFNRSLRRATWIIYIGVAIALGAVISLSLLKGYDLSQGAMFAGIGLIMIPYFAYYKRSWAAPARQLARRVPIARERSSEEVRRLQFQRMSYGQLASAAFGGLMIPFIGSFRKDVFSGWNRLWLVFGVALISFAAVQAFRKWQFEREETYRNVIPQTFNRVTAKPTGDAASSQTKGHLWRYVPFAAVILALAFIAYTPAGKQLARTPSFWPIVMIALGSWSVFTAVRGFSKGQIEPFARGFYNTYERETQPKRFWASIAWNTVFGMLLIGLGFTISGDIKAERVEDSCYAEHAAPKGIIAACNQLLEQRPRNSDAYLNRGLAYLNSWKFDQAIADFTEAHELNPKSAWPLANRGLAYAWKNDRARAESDFGMVEKIDPANPVVLHGQAMLSMNAGDLETAIDKLTTALKINPRDSWSLQTRADAYQQRGDFEQARADRDRLRQLASTANAASSTHS